MSKPFVPAFGGKTLVPGCSDKTPRDLFLAEQERSSSPVVRNFLAMLIKLLCENSQTPRHKFP
jgi:hypothetical protein